MLCFFRVVFIPLGNFDDDIFRAVGDALAAEARLRRDAGSLVELIELGDLPGLQALRVART